MRIVFIILAVCFLWGCRGSKDLSGGIRLRVDSLYVAGDTLWFGMEARNTSAFYFRPSGIRFMMRERQPLKRKARQEIALSLVGGNPPTLLPSDSTIHFDVGIRPRIPGPGRELWIEWIERSGDRRARVRLSNKRIMRARRVSGIQ